MGGGQKLGSAGSSKTQRLIRSLIMLLAEILFLSLSVHSKNAAWSITSRIWVSFIALIESYRLHISGCVKWKQGMIATVSLHLLRKETLISIIIWKVKEGKTRPILFGSVEKSTIGTRRLSNYNRSEMLVVFDRIEWRWSFHHLQAAVFFISKSLLGFDLFHFLAVSPLPTWASPGSILMMVAASFIA